MKASPGTKLRHAPSCLGLLTLLWNYTSQGTNTESQKYEIKKRAQEPNTCYCAATKQHGLARPYCQRVASEAKLIIEVSEVGQALVVSISRITF